MTSDDPMDGRLGEIADLPEDHPDRIAFVADPKRRVLLREYSAFMDAEPATGSDPEAAREALDAVLAREIARTPRRAPRRVPARRRRRWIGGAVAAAAVIVLAVGIRDMVPDASGPSGVMRGGGLEDFSLIDVALDSDGAIFRWTAAAGAQGYELVLYRPDLTEAHRSAVVVDTFLTIEREFLQSLGADTWGVIATAAGDEITRSRLGTVDFLSGAAGER